MLPNVIRGIILDYAATWELLDWLCLDEINWHFLSENSHPAAIELMLANPGKADWGAASDNPNAWPYLRDHPSEIDFNGIAMNTNKDAFELIIQAMSTFTCDPRMLSSNSNPAVVDWLTKNPDYIYWDELSQNEAARELVCANPDEIDWYSINQNESHWAMELLEKNPDNYHSILARNPFGFDLLMKYAALSTSPVESFISWIYLSQNPDPRAVELAMTHKDLIDWRDFSKLAAAIPYLQKNKHRLDWKTLSANPGIFQPQRPAGVFELL